MSSNNKGDKKAKRDRYWSVMLVGDHGRVIPFRHFKILAISICSGFILLLAAVVVLAYLHTNQLKRVEALESQISASQLQNKKLKDEKEFYLTKLKLKEFQGEGKTEKKPDSKPGSGVSTTPPQGTENLKPKTIEPVKEAPTPKPTTKVKQMADVRRFSVTYDAKREILKAQFRIYNKSKPKKSLSGRSVAVFKALDDPAVKWKSAPRVQLEDGKPKGTKGEAFKVRNYMTMRFRLYLEKAPIRYNSVTAYVYSTDGQLLTSKNFSFKIVSPSPVKPATPAMKEQIKPAPAIESKPQTPVQNAADTNADKARDAITPSPTVPAQDSGKTGVQKEPAAPDALTPDSQPPTIKEDVPALPNASPKDPLAPKSDSSKPVKEPATGGQDKVVPSAEPRATVPKP